MQIVDTCRWTKRVNSVSVWPWLPGRLASFTIAKNIYSRYSLSQDSERISIWDRKSSIFNSGIHQIGTRNSNFSLLLFHQFLSSECPMRYLIQQVLSLIHLRLPKRHQKVCLNQHPRVPVLKWAEEKQLRPNHLLWKHLQQKKVSS